MSVYENLDLLIKENIKQNNARKITGIILQETLLEMVKTQGQPQDILWSDLRDLKIAKSLIPGRFYRITDYITTTSQVNTQSAGHQFDIIVFALTNNTLSERAWACHHEGDTYFQNSHLESWQIWYCLDNDTERFAWADTADGKGVIYRMIDEWNNDCCYDFKNIQSKHPSKQNSFYYTFSSSTKEDYSLGGLCIDNIINPHRPINDKKYFYIPKVIFCDSYGYNYKIEHNKIIDSSSIYFEDGCSYNNIGHSCSNITFNRYCTYNNFGDHCSKNKLGNGCAYNTFGDECDNNDLSDNSRYNTFGSSCSNNKLKSNNNVNNTFYDNCCDNTFSGLTKENVFNTGFKGNTIFGECRQNIFGSAVTDNVFNGEVIGNTCGSNISNNVCGGLFVSNSIDSFFIGNSVGKGFRRNTIGASCRRIQVGTYIQDCVIGNSVTDVKFCLPSGVLNNFYQYIIIESGVKHVNLINDQTASSNNNVRYIYITSEVNNKDINVLRNYISQKRVSINDIGDIKQFCIADLIQ